MSEIRKNKFGSLIDSDIAKALFQLRKNIPIKKKKELIFFKLKSTKYLFCMI